MYKKDNHENLYILHKLKWYFIFHFAVAMPTLQKSVLCFQKELFCRRRDL